MRPIDVIEDEMRQPSVFKDESKLSIDYIPPTLPHRENELRTLTRMFRGVLSKPGSMSVRVVITGKIGTGKTAITKLFGSKVERYAKERGINLSYIHVNCRLERTEYLILRTIVSRFIPNLPGRGLSPEELLKILMFKLEQEGLNLIITLDEADFLIRSSSSDLIYKLTRAVDDRLNPKQRISLIFVVRDTEYRYLLDSSTLSTLQHNLIRLSKYSYEELLDIIKARVEEAFFDGVVGEEAMKLVAEIASKNGDARYALELIWRAGKIAEFSRVYKITPEHVRQAQSEIHPMVRKENLYFLSKPQKVFLLSIARALKKSDRAYVTFGEVESIYKVTCEEYGLKARKHTQLWEYLKIIEETGLVSLRLSGKGIKGRTTLITLEEIPAKTLENELIRLLEGGDKVEPYEHI
ncbi:MAG: ORC1-type DNA replication protein [Candidatus Odinarchaeota archaeon]|nr:ORC1-type DNA replication protein [Candidatus Odinarchaeota archaeon]